MMPKNKLEELTIALQRPWLKLNMTSTFSAQTQNDYVPEIFVACKLVPSFDDFSNQCSSELEHILKKRPSVSPKIRINIHNIKKDSNVLPSTNSQLETNKVSEKTVSPLIIPIPRAILGPDGNSAVAGKTAKTMRKSTTGRSKRKVRDVPRILANSKRRFKDLPKNIRMLYRRYKIKDCFVFMHKVPYTDYFPFRSPVCYTVTTITESEYNAEMLINSSDQNDKLKEIKPMAGPSHTTDGGMQANQTEVENIRVQTVEKIVSEKDKPQPAVSLLTQSEENVANNFRNSPNSKLSSEVEISEKSNLPAVEIFMNKLPSSTKAVKIARIPTSAKIQSQQTVLSMPSLPQVEVNRQLPSMVKSHSESKKVEYVCKSSHSSNDESLLQNSLRIERLSETISHFSKDNVKSSSAKQDWHSSHSSLGRSRIDSPVCDNNRVSKSPKMVENSLPNSDGTTEGRTVSSQSTPEQKSSSPNHNEHDSSNSRRSAKNSFKVGDKDIPRRHSLGSQDGNEFSSHTHSQTRNTGERRHRRYNSNENRSCSKSDRRNSTEAGHTSRPSAPGVFSPISESVGNNDLENRELRSCPSLEGSESTFPGKECISKLILRVKNFDTVPTEPPPDALTDSTVTLTQLSAEAPVAIKQEPIDSTSNNSSEPPLKKLKPDVEQYYSWLSRKVKKEKVQMIELNLKSVDFTTYTCFSCYTDYTLQKDWANHSHSCIPCTP